MGLVAFVFIPALKCPFLCFDDPDYVTSNSHVKAGFTWSGVRWAVSSTEAGNWHPVTWMSHMLDCQMYGLAPRGHHLSNVMIHAANTALVFLLLRFLTGFGWRSFLVAGLFGLHPLRIESVAWVSERKDVLSMFFFLLTIWAYCEYARTRARLGHRDQSSSEVKELMQRSNAWMWWYLLAVGVFALGLASKPMLVTVPFVLLLLDYWPLNRLRLPRLQQPSGQPENETWQGLLVEKTPFFVLSAFSSVVTWLAQQEAMGRDLSLGSRIGNALVSYCAYLGKIFWPARLAIFYPWDYSSTGQVIWAGILLAVVSLLVFGLSRRCPCLAVGWLWFIGMLVPVIGIVQVGEQSMADRYTYIPSIGVFIAIVWSVSEIVQRKRMLTYGATALASLALIACIICSRQQLGYWHENELLFRRSLSISGPNSTAYTCLAITLKTQNRVQEAWAMYLEALRVQPRDPLARTGLGGLLFESGRMDEALREFHAALEVKPRDANALVSVGAVLFEQGNLEEAIAKYREALRNKPDYALAHYNLAAAFRKLGRSDDSIRQYKMSILLDPDYAPAHVGFGNILAEAGRLKDAGVEYEQALRLDPFNSDAHYNLAKVLEAQGMVEFAIVHYQEVLLRKPAYVEAHCGLASALSTAGRFPEAIEHYSVAIGLRPTYAPAHRGLGATLAAKGAIEEALDQFCVATDYDPADVSSRVALGHLLVRTGRLDEAMVQYRAAVRLSPESAGAHYFLASALAEKGEIDEASQQFTETLRIVPNSADAHSDLGRVLLSKGKYEEAAGHFERAAVLDPNNPDTQNNLGASLFRAGRLSEAITHFRESLRLKPDLADAQRNLTTALEAQQASKQ
jgi:tetratricopeptide (TPR) repeat protein